MKVVLQCEPDKLEKVLNDTEEYDVILDQKTYCYFRDELFIPQFEDYINKNHPGELHDEQVLGSEGVEGAKKFFITMRNYEVMHKHYKEYCKVRQRFYFHEGAWYVMDLLGFGNIGNEISLMRLDYEEVADLLNNQDERTLSRIERINHAIASVNTRLREFMHFDLSSAFVPMTLLRKTTSLTYGVVATAVIGAWFTEAWLFILLWRWFVIPLGVSDITYVHGFGLYLLWSFIKTPNYRKKLPHEDSGIEYWKSYAFHSYVIVAFVLVLAWPTHLALQRLWP